MTLVELLVAMMVLLVGIYAVAALFPQMSQNVVEEETRTSMGKLVEQMAARYQSGADEPPAATAPADANVDLVNPSDRPQDPDSSTTPPNPRDDMIWVYGERFTVPAPAIAGTAPAYVPKQGYIDLIGATETLASVLQVSEVRELKEMSVDPGPTGAVPSGQFYLRADGLLRANSGTAWVEVSYDSFYTASDIVTGVHGELAPPDTYVACTARGALPVVGTAKASAYYQWSGTINTPPPAPGGLNFLADPLAGQVLYFPVAATGAEMRINYRLRRENGRRQLAMQEDKVFPTTTPYEIQLGFGNLHDEKSLFDTTFSGGAINDIYVMITDLTDGEEYLWDGSGPGSIAYVDFVRGIVGIDPTLLAGRLGNPIRVYYRTLDDHCIHVQKAPSEFVEWDGATATGIPNTTHRTYRIGAGAGFTGSAAHTCLYDFPGYCEDQAVQVDYLAYVNGMPVRVSNEIHVIGDLGAALGFGFVLNQPDVAGVLSVGGASMRVTGWWRTYSGRVGRVDIANMLFPG